MCKSKISSQSSLGSTQRTSTHFSTRLTVCWTFLTWMRTPWGIFLAADKMALSSTRRFMATSRYLSQRMTRQKRNLSKGSSQRSEEMLSLTHCDKNDIKLCSTLEHLMNYYNVPESWPPLLVSMKTVAIVVSWSVFGVSPRYCLQTQEYLRSVWKITCHSNLRFVAL